MKRMIAAVSSALAFDSPGQSLYLADLVHAMKTIWFRQINLLWTQRSGLFVRATALPHSLNALILKDAAAWSRGSEWKLEISTRNNH